MKNPSVLLAMVSFFWIPGLQHTTAQSISCAEYAEPQPFPDCTYNILSNQSCIAQAITPAIPVANSKMETVDEPTEGEQDGTAEIKGNMIVDVGCGLSSCYRVT